MDDDRGRGRGRGRGRPRGRAGRGGGRARARGITPRALNFNPLVYHINFIYNDPIFISY